jgi:hypothetical protein
MSKRGHFLRVLALLCCAALLAVAWNTANRSRASRESQEFAAYYRESISPLIDSAQAREQQAVDLALARLHEHFDYFRRGVPNFTRDVTGWGTRFGIVGRSIGDLWTRAWQDKSHAVAVREYTEQKFRAWVINEQTLGRALQDTLTTFSEATNASRNRLESEIKLAISHPQSPLKLPPLDLDHRLAAATQSSRAIAARAGSDSTLIGAGAFAGGWIAGDAARALTTAIVARLGAGMATTAVTSGSATATGAAAGGGGGSAAGPLGTIVGLGVGIVAGALIDWAINDHFEQRLSAQCTTFLNQLEADLANGARDQAGLRSLLTEAARKSSSSYRDVLFAELEKATRP